MPSSLVYGVVIDQIFYSNRIERKIENRIDNGIYSIDTSVNDLWSTLQLANIVDATAFFRRASRIQVIRGVSFHDGIVPDNPVAFPSVPLPVKDGQFEEFEIIEVALLRNKICYFLQTLNINESYVLLDLKECFEKEGDFAKLRGITPAMRLVYGFHKLEKKQKEELKPVNIIKSSLEETGARVLSIHKRRNGYEILWESTGHTINTLIDGNFRVINAGFCVSNYDRTQSIQSVGNLLKDYVHDGSTIHLTRTLN